MSFALPVSGFTTRVMPTSSTAAPGFTQSGLHQAGHSDGGDDDVGTADIFFDADRA